MTLSGNATRLSNKAEQRDMKVLNKDLVDLKVANDIYFNTNQDS